MNMLPYNIRLLTNVFFLLRGASLRGAPEVKQLK